MEIFKTVWFLSFLLISHPSLVRSQGYNLSQILICVRVVTNGVADASNKIVPLFKDLIKCMSFKTREKLDDLNTINFRALVSAFLSQLVERPSCLMAMSESMEEFIELHKAQFTKYKCGYLGVAPECVPNN